MDAELDESPISAAALSKLRWRCRRGLLENDLFIERFFNRYAEGLSERRAQGLLLLMDLPDNDLLDLFLDRQPVSAELDVASVHEVLALMRSPWSAGPPA